MECSIEVGHISAFMHPATLAVGNGRAPHFRARYEEYVAREGGRYAPVRRVLGSEPLSLRTQTSWSVTAAQECRCREPGSISSGLTSTLREDWACKRALETPCHARITTSLRDPTAMSPDHWSKLTWDTVSAGAMTS